MNVGTWVIRPNGKPAVVVRVTPIKGIWVFRDEVLSTIVDVEWVGKSGVVKRATHDITEVKEVPRA